MLLDTLNALSQAGIKVLQTTCGLDVQDKEISLVREGRQDFPFLATLRIKGCPLQVVHLGCDDKLAGALAQVSGDSGEGSGLEFLAENFLALLLDQFDARNPRGVVETREAAPATLHTRGVRTFRFRLDTGRGRLFFLAEVPSRAELALARGSEFMTSMESIYLPGDWHATRGISETEAVDNFLTFLRKTEGDIYLETPAGDETATLNTGLLLEVVRLDDRPVLEILTDFSDRDGGVPTAGCEVKAGVGVGDRSLGFVLTYLGSTDRELASGLRLPCARFSLPVSVTVGQRRRTFRVPVPSTVRVEIEMAPDGSEAGSWSDDGSPADVITGRLADLSFSGARIIADHPRLCSSFHKDNRVVCRMSFPESEKPLQVMGIIRRSTVGPVDRDKWLDEIGLEFLVSPGGDRSGLDYLRQFVLEVQRSKLAQRLQVAPA